MFISQKKFGEIRNAAKEGNEKAQKVLQAMRSFSPQEDIDRLVEDYYKVDSFQPVIETTQTEETKVPEMVNEQVQDTAQGEIEAPLKPEIENDVDNEEEFFDILNGETDGLFDENDIQDISFNDFLQNKKRDGLRAKKNADYFKAYDVNGRNAFMKNKIDSYKGKFDGRYRDINRRYNDIGLSLDSYIQKTNDMLDDDKELNIDVAGQAYSDFVGDDSIMHSFGRYWDQEDSQAILDSITKLVQTYGKKNVLAVLNNLKNDNESYRQYQNNQIDTEIGRYSKSVESLLK